MTGLINEIHNSGYIHKDFKKSVFISIPKGNKVQDCSDFKTMELISHASPVLLHLKKKTLIVEREVGKSQMNFRNEKA